MAGLPRALVETAAQATARGRPVQAEQAILPGWRLQRLLRPTLQVYNRQPSIQAGGVSARGRTSEIARDLGQSKVLS